VICALRTPLGIIAVEQGPSGICRVVLPPACDGVKVDAIAPPGLVAVFTDFFALRPIRAGVHLDLVGTSFQRDVWAAIASIKAGRTRSYGQIACDIGRPKATRAVGNACGKNPVPLLVPCHRVVAGDGARGGFSSPMWIKHALLDHEAGLNDLAGPVEPVCG
jgi:methylated-DNA-[protein]-cysteine S-methyltransferase